MLATELFHNGGLLMYSFTYMIIKLSDFVLKESFSLYFSHANEVRKAYYHTYKRIY